MRPNIYDITFKSEVGPALRAEFEDCEIIVGSGTTTLRAELPDQAALWGLVQRIGELGLEVTDLHLLTPPAAGVAANKVTSLSPSHSVRAV